MALRVEEEAESSIRKRGANPNSALLREALGLVLPLRLGITEHSKIG